LEHPLYRIDFSLSDYHLFGALKLYARNSWQSQRNCKWLFSESIY